MRLRTGVIIGSFGTIAALGFATALIMIGVAQICEAISCAWASVFEPEDGSC